MRPAKVPLFSGLTPELDLAVKHLETAVKGQPNAKRKYHLAMAYYKVGDDKRGQVLAKEALKEDPKVAETPGAK